MIFVTPLSEHLCYQTATLHFRKLVEYFVNVLSVAIPGNLDRRAAQITVSPEKSASYAPDPEVLPRGSKINVSLLWMQGPATYSLRQSWLVDIAERGLDSSFLKAVSGVKLSGLLQHPHPGIVEFPLLNEEYAQGLVREFHAYEHWCQRQKKSPIRPNSMNNYGLVLSEIGLEGVIDELLYTWISPLASRLFPQFSGTSLDHQHAFVVDYAVGGDRSLGFHVDDSEVTLNVCLGLTFAGANVYFRGVRCESHREDAANENEKWQWAPAPGRAILHAGAHRHGVLPLISGRRVNLIVWARSSRHRRTHTSPHAGPVDWCSVCQAP